MAARPARRGRPPKSDGATTYSRLLDAATTVCAEHGFDGATLHKIADRAGVTAAAVYNHFSSRQDLLYAAGVRGLQSMTDAAAGNGAADFRSIARAYLRPDMADTRRLLAELHVASRRDQRLAWLLQDWHTRMAAQLAGALTVDEAAAAATVKALFLVLLGLCHVDDLEAVDADPDLLAERVSSLAATLQVSG